MTRGAHALVLSLLAACQTAGGAAGGAASGAKGEKGGLVAVQASSDSLASAYAPRRFALLVGISEFADPAWRGLRFPARDVDDLSAALRDPGRGAFDEVARLTTATETTRASVLAGLKALASRATRADDVVLLYFSAHGTLARDGRGLLKRYLVTEDTSFADVGHTALAMDEVKEEFDRLGSRRRVLVLATCHSGSGKSLLPADLEKELEGVKAGFYARPLEEASRASIVLSASDWGETAREDEALGHDIYTNFLIEALDGAGDRNGDGAVSATEAHDFARRRTFAFTGGRQRPSAEILEVGADPVLLSGRLSRLGHPELYSYSARLDGFTLTVDGEAKGELPGGAAVSAGRRRVELTKGGDVLLRREVDVSDGDRIDLENLVSPQAPSNTLALLGGVLSFVDARSRAELLPAAFSAGVWLRLDEALARRLGLDFTLTAGAGREVLHLPGGEVPFRYRSLGLSAGVPYLVRVGRFGGWAGPRVAALWLTRSFELDGYRGDQSYATLSPGIAAGAGFAVTDRLELSVQGQLMLMVVVVDGKSQASGFGGAWAGAGWRF